MTAAAPKAKRKPWVIFVTDNRELGKAVKLLARPTEGRWTMGRRRAAKFRTEEEARQHLTTVEREGGKTYLVSRL